MDQKKQYPAARARIEKQKQAFLEILVKNGIIEFACQKNEISRQTYYRWRKEDSEFRKSVDEAIRQGSEIMDDLAESALMKLIQSGDRASTIFYLKYRNPKYSDRAAIRRTILEQGAEEDPGISEEDMKHINETVEAIHGYQKHCEEEMERVMEEQRAHESPQKSEEEVRPSIS